LLDVQGGEGFIIGVGLSGLRYWAARVGEGAAMTGTPDERADRDVTDRSRGAVR